MVKVDEKWDRTQKIPTKFYKENTKRGTCLEEPGVNDDDDDDDDDNNNNNIYLLQLGCHPVAVVILHVYKTWNWLLLNLSREDYMRSM